MSSARLREHDRAVASMFGRIARFYDPLNRILSLGIDRSWRKALARAAKSGSKGVMLDLAAGTLDVSLGLAGKFPGDIVLAMDFCPPMLELGLPKIRRAGCTERLVAVAADARALPLADNSVDCVTMAFGIRNIIPRESAFREMLRVLAPGGKACILEFGSGRERIWLGLYNFYLARLLPLIGRLVSSDANAYAYLATTIRAFPAADELALEMTAAGFESVGWQKLSSGIACLHVGQKPEQPGNFSSASQARPEKGPKAGP